MISEIEARDIVRCLDDTLRRYGLDPDNRLHRGMIYEAVTFGVTYYSQPDSETREFYRVLDGYRKNGSGPFEDASANDPKPLVHVPE